VGLENSGGTIILDFDAILENSAIVNNITGTVFNMTADDAVLNGGIYSLAKTASSHLRTAAQCSRSAT
jgi:hypothetical protein